MMQTKGNFSDAVNMLSKCLVMQVEVHGGQNHSSVADTYDMLGFVEVKRGDLDTSLEHLQDGLKVRKEVGDKLKEGDALFNIGNLYRERGEFDMALECYQGCQEIRTAEHGPVSQSVADVIMAQGKVQSDIERGMLTAGSSLTATELAGALEFFKKALQIHYTINGLNDISVASTLEMMGMAQFRVGKLVSARKYLENSVEVYRKCSKKVAESKLVTPLFVIGNIHQFMKEEEDAERVWKEAFQCNTSLGEERNPQIHKIISDVLLEPIS